MAFDLRTALLVLGNSSGSPLDAIATSYGVPECLLTLGKDVLNALPTPFLRSITKALNEGAETAKESVAALSKKILMENGIIEIDTDSGTFKFVSDSSKNKLDESQDKESGSLGDFLNALGAAAGAGAELYSNYVGVMTMLQGVEDCLNTYKTFLDLQKGRSVFLADPADLEARFFNEIARARDAQNFIDQANRVLSDITSITLDRLRNPALEPQFNPLFAPSGTQTEPGVEPPPIFRLVFGPPKSKKGQFLLSVDGLYYDSQTGGLPVVSGTVFAPLAHTFNYDANIGGKGVAITSRDLKQFVDTIFDPDLIDDSSELQTHYDADHFLQVLYGQRHQHLYALSAQIGSLLAEGYNADSAMVENSRQQLMAIESQHMTKINKRKKQIEVAIKAPTLFGSSRIFNFGEVPINDFSFLSKINLAVALEPQRRLTFNQGEVSGVVLPLQPKFVKASESDSAPFFEHLVVPPVGIGSLMFEGSGAASSQVLSLTDSVVVNGLIAIYNFLESDVTTPGSTQFNVLNCAAKSNKQKAAQLVSQSPSSVFLSGLGIPFLQGMTRRDSTTGALSSFGNYIQLPNEQDFQNLFYNPDGCTIDFWTHIPDLTTSSTEYYTERGWSVSSFHKLVLACENSGGINRAESPDNLQVNYGSDFVRGLVCGFSRDAQIVSNSIANDASGSNPVVPSGIHFYIAPTRSYNVSELGFLRDTITVDCATDIYKTFKCSIPITTQVNGASFGQVSGEFCHIAITSNPKKDQIKFYLDGNLMVTSSLREVFGNTKFQAPKIPTFVQTGSFSYSTSATGLTGFINGPSVSSFTPWIVGGGFTDGMPDGFMSGNNGLHSGLGGFIGSLKFYSRALDINEVIFNFDNQKGFFKSIDV